MNSSTVLFIIFIVVQIPSFFCAMQILRFRRTNNPLLLLPNHLLLCLLMISLWIFLVDLPVTEMTLWLGVVPIRTTWACVSYNISFFTATGLNRMYMAFMSIERHFLVFRPQLYRTRRCRILFHYIPILVITLFQLFYFFLTSAVVSCPQLHFSYSRMMCGYTCTILMPQLMIYYIWIEVLIPTVITVCGCILLPVRFVWHKRNLQRLQWRRARKMIVQTCVISSAYIVCWVTYIVMAQLLVNGIVTFADPNVSLYFLYGPYITSFVTPFIVQHTIPGWVNARNLVKVKHRLRRRHLNSIQPHNAFVTAPVNRPTIEHQ